LLIQNMAFVFFAKDVVGQTLHSEG